MLCFRFLEPLFQRSSNCPTQNLNIMATNKTKFKGSFNWNGQMFIMYKYSYNQTQAFRLFVKDIAGKVKYSSNYVGAHFRKKTDSYRIGIVK